MSNSVSCFTNNNWRLSNLCVICWMAASGIYNLCHLFYKELYEICFSNVYYTYHIIRIIKSNTPLCNFILNFVSSQDWMWRSGQVVRRRKPKIASSTLVCAWETYLAKFVLLGDMLSWREIQFRQTTYYQYNTKH